MSRHARLEPNLLLLPQHNRNNGHNVGGGLRYLSIGTVFIPSQALEATIPLRHSQKPSPTPALCPAAHEMSSQTHTGHVQCKVHAEGRPSRGGGVMWWVGVSRGTKPRPLTGRRTTAQKTEQHRTPSLVLSF